MGTCFSFFSPAGFSVRHRLRFFPETGRGLSFLSFGYWAVGGRGAVGQGGAVARLITFRLLIGAELNMMTEAGKLPCCGAGAFPSGKTGVVVNGLVPGSSLIASQGKPASFFSFGYRAVGGRGAVGQGGA